MEVIEQKRQALMKENLLIQMMDAQRTHVNDELIKIPYLPLMLTFFALFLDCLSSCLTSFVVYLLVCVAGLLHVI
jgi:hypothetical protein